jgi:hypothetical protein
MNRRSQVIGMNPEYERRPRLEAALVRSYQLPPIRFAPVRLPASFRHPPTSASRRRAGYPGDVRTVITKKVGTVAEA